MTGFVTRRGGAELLVFRHPQAGIQLPAGSIEPGEPPEQAALREVWEETGVRAELVGSLGTLVKDLPPDRGIALRDEGPLRRGWSLVVREERDGQTLAFMQEFDVSHTPWRLLAEHGGWVPSDAVGRRVVRHLVHLRAPDGGPDRWSHAADLGHVFEPFWTPLGFPARSGHVGVPAVTETPYDRENPHMASRVLESRPELVSGQDEWLDAVYAILMVRSGGLRAPPSAAR